MLFIRALVSRGGLGLLGVLVVFLSCQTENARLPPCEHATVRGRALAYLVTEWDCPSSGADLSDWWCFFESKAVPQHIWSVGKVEQMLKSAGLFDKASARLVPVKVASVLFACADASNGPLVLVLDCPNGEAVFCSPISPNQAQVIWRDYF